MPEFSWLAEELSAFQEGLFAMKLLMIFMYKESFAYSRCPVRSMSRPRFDLQTANWTDLLQVYGFSPQN